MKDKELKKQQEVEERIRKQVELWDLYAKIIPTLFLVVTGLLILCDAISFNQAFWWGIGAFAITAVTWWFWTIFTIRELINTLQRASSNLHEVRSEFKKISVELDKIKDD